MCILIICNMLTTQSETSFVPELEQPGQQLYTAFNQLSIPPLMSVSLYMAYLLKI